MELDPEASETLAAMTAAMLLAHDLVVERQGALVVAPAAGLRCEARVFLHSRPAGSVCIQADLAFESDVLDGRTMLESCGGSGETISDSVKDAFGKFVRSVAHVILAVLVAPRLGEEQVEWETWESAEGAASVCLGPLLQMGAAAHPSQAFGGFLDILRDGHVKSLDGRLHWIRVYYCVDASGRAVAEVLLDNEPWLSAQAALGQYPWPSADAWYSFRCFLVVMPAGRPTRG